MFSAGIFMMSTTVSKLVLKSLSRVSLSYFAMIPYLRDRSLRPDSPHYCRNSPLFLVTWRSSFIYIWLFIFTFIRYFLWKQHEYLIFFEIVRNERDIWHRPQILHCTIYDRQKKLGWPQPYVASDKLLLGGDSHQIAMYALANTYSGYSNLVPFW